MIKIKILLTCVCKECEGKMKIVQEQWLQLNMKGFLAYKMKIVIYCGVGEVKPWWRQSKFGRDVYWGEDFSRWKKMIRFLKYIAQKHNQMNIPNLLNGWQATAGFIGKWFKKAFFVNKNVHSYFRNSLDIYIHTIFSLSNTSLNGFQI